MKIILIDGEEKEHDGLYVYGLNIHGEKCRVSFHGYDVLEHHCAIKNENVKLVTKGHLYVLNYNSKTFIPTYPMTFKEYQENGNKL